MSKVLAGSLGPYKYDDDEDYVPTQKIKYSSKDDGSIHSKKHTLDSDEEDEDTKVDKKTYNILDDEDIDGQEAPTIDHDGDVQITPFNMKEELEEGHFDRDGFYHFKKDKNDIKDAWLDDIDWVKIKHQEDAPNKYGSDDESDSEYNNVATFKPDSTSNKELYHEMFQFLKPQETLAKSLKRLGGTKKRLSTAQRWKLKKQGKLIDDSQDMESFMKLTDIVNQMVAAGNMDIYEETYEMINIKIQRWNASAEPCLDMFADSCPPPPAKKQKTDENVFKPNDITEDKSSEMQQQVRCSEEVKWEYKWEESETSEIHGPFSAQQMSEWKDSDYFKDGTFVRKIEQNPGSWYKSNRIDFDLFT